MKKSKKIAEKMKGFVKEFKMWVMVNYYDFQKNSKKRKTLATVGALTVLATTPILVACVQQEQDANLGAEENKPSVIVSNEQTDADLNWLDDISKFGIKENLCKEITFDFVAPEGYQFKGTIEDSDIQVYTKGKDKVAFVCEKPIMTKSSYEFGKFPNLTDLSFKNVCTSNVTDMHLMFGECRNLTSLDLSSFDTSNVTDMNSMFYGCRNLTVLNVSGFDTSNVIDMGGMFCECQNLASLNLSNFNTSNVRNMSWMFENCQNLVSLNLSSFNTPKVTNMKRMFSGCSNLTSLDLSNFETSNDVYMDAIFCNCQNLNEILVGENWKRTINSNAMFDGCKSQDVTFNEANMGKEC